MRPLIAITMGDAAGIGPEIVIKALGSREILAICRPLIIGSGAVLLATQKALNSHYTFHVVKDIIEVQDSFNVISLLDLENLNTNEVTAGKVCSACGRASMEYIARAVELALAGKVAAIVTAPINKEATRLAGYREVGHLEHMAQLSHAVEYATMLVSGTLRVVHLTTHYSLKDALQFVTGEKILARLKLTHESFQKWGIGSPRIAVAALNPHGGEGGLFGREEIEQIMPAVKEAQSQGIKALGPYPADSVFTRAIKGEFDAVLALYHDQGHIAVKVHGFEDSVSVALGLPFIRTSVDHGTAYDIAGKGIAESRSLEEAIRTAVRLVEGKILQKG
jgi:4-phospho-D-threonate 3-dehydrogenase / 4-phospho-D-erythronate 3-dehydrogenase